MSVQGVDVASYQPAVFSTKGYSFVFVKATQSNDYINPEYHSQLNESRNGGCVTGHYHFLVPGNVTAQVSYFLSHSDVKPGEVVALDWESLNGAWPSNADKDAWIKAVKAKLPHNRVGLYTNRDGWLTHDQTSYCGDFLWIADPGVSAPRIKHAWTFWQDGSTTIGGHSFDHDVANFPNVDALKTWAGVPVSHSNAPTVPTQAYRDVILNDVFPTPAGHVDSGGTGQWTLQTVISELFAYVEGIDVKLNQIIDEINASKTPAAPTVETPQGEAK